MNFLSQGEVQHLDNDRFWAYGCLLIVLSGIHVILSQECICWVHFGPRGNLPLQVKVLEKEGPPGLSSGWFLRVFDIREVFVVSDGGDRMHGPLEILAPFFQCQDYHKKFTVIDVIVLLGVGEGAGEVSAGVQV